MLRTLRTRLRIDPYIVALLATVVLASVFPARGVAAAGVNDASTFAIGLLFFLYGARLSVREAVDGLKHWRLHSAVLASTFLLFPILGLIARLLVPQALTADLYVGLMFLCCLPSTVQSSIAFTSMAKGNVAAAICSASLSNIIGIALTPLLVAGLLVTGGAGFSWGSIGTIVGQLLAPFVAGQLLRRWLAPTLSKHKRVFDYVDRGSILLVVYSAFSEGVVLGIWHQVHPIALLSLIAVDAVLLAAVLVITTVVARRMKFSLADEIVIVFCGSKKSLASGVPMARVLFPNAAVALTVLPLMLFHQLQLIVCAELARRYAAKPQPAAITENQVAP
jgi:sodium/bile acid cotransporter 7